MTLGERLRQLRQRSGLSQEDVAQKLFVSRQSVSKWELDQAEPSVDNLRVLAKLYDVTLDELLAGEDSGGPAQQEPSEPAPDESEFVRRYRSVVLFRTAVMVVSNLLSMAAGRIDFPLDWLAMLVGLFVRSSAVWVVTTVLIVINIVANIVFLTADPARIILSLLLHILTLWLFSRREVKAYFHMSEEKGE